MKTTELKNKSADDLKQLALETEKEVFVMQMKRAAGQLANVAGLIKSRRNVAQIKTEIRRRAGV